ncbi:hypothetical protein Tco_1264220 [Tanacetum coccineum]
MQGCVIRGQESCQWGEAVSRDSATLNGIEIPSPCEQTKCQRKYVIECGEKGSTRYSDLCCPGYNLDAEILVRRVDIACHGVTYSVTLMVTVLYDAVEDCVLRDVLLFTVIVFTTAYTYLRLSHMTPASLYITELRKRVGQTSGSSRVSAALAHVSSSDKCCIDEYRESSDVVFVSRQ